MITQEYLRALQKLSLRPHGKRTAALLGIGLRHAQRIAAGQAAVPRYAALLLAQYLAHGLPPGPVDGPKFPR